MSGEKTEQPTHKKLEDARKKGQVALSKDVVHVGSLIFAFSVVLFDTFNLNASFSSWFDVIFNHIAQKNPISYSSLILSFLKDVFFFSLPVVGAAVIGGLVATFSQIGFVLSFEAIKPSFKRFDFVENIKNMFSMKSFVQLFLSILKIIALGIVSFLVLRAEINNFIYLPSLTITELGSFFAYILRYIFYTTFVLFLLIAIIDFVVVYRHYIKGLKMSKQEVFQEYKDQEGDPHIKGHRKQLARELIEKPPEELLASSKAVVTNPTHIAICMTYDPQVHDLPWILAIRDGFEAQKIIELAKKQGVPVIRHLQFARGLYRKGSENAYVPSEHVKAAAVILKSVMQWTQLDEKERLKKSQWILD